MSIKLGSLSVALNGDNSNPRSIRYEVRINEIKFKGEGVVSGVPNLTTEARKEISKVITNSVVPFLMKKFEENNVEVKKGELEILYKGIHYD